MSTNKLLFIFFSCFFSIAATAQTPYTITPDDHTPGQLVYKGIINKYTLMNEPSFNWYVYNQSSYNISTEMLNGFEKAKSNFYFILFGGTWCDDTQFILSRFFKLQEKVGIADSTITFFGVDRNKKTIGNVAEAFQITRVPTIIVMKDGQEVGRLVEYGKTGSWDTELMSFIK
jgi:thiol-disulfide isomerase/thioredoxin